MNILVIDDNVALGETQAMMLDVLGHTPTIAVTGYAGIEAAKTCRPQLILLDLGLPDIDGNEVCRQLRQIKTLGDVVIVAQTGRNDTSDFDAAKASGFDRVIVKPAPVEQLQELIASIDQG